MKALYFGPYKEAGHFMFNPGGTKASAAQETECPWPQIDGVLQLNCLFKFMRWESGAQPEGESLLHYRNGWTALSMWDRSIDKHGNSNSNFFYDAHLSFIEAVGESVRCFGDRILKMGFPIAESKSKANALLCPSGENYAGHVPAIVHRSGKVSAEVLNTCGICGAAIGNWYGQWVALDSWSESKIREGGRMWL